MPTAPVVDEKNYQPRSMRQTRELYAALCTVTNPMQARSIVLWLVMLPNQDDVHPVQRSRYRQILHELGGPPWEEAGAA